MSSKESYESAKQRYADLGVDTEQALRRAQKMDAIGQMAGGIAHDFNNLLGVIIGNADLLKYGDADERDVAARLEAISKSAERAADLTKQLLGFSRQRATRTATVDLNAVVRNMDTLIVRTLTPEVTVVHDLDESLWPVEVDPGDLEDALLNLVINARDAMSGSGVLTITTANCEPSTAAADDDTKVSGVTGPSVALTISDTGHGIESVDLDRIFEPFFTTKAHGRGTGLGLSMVYGFVSRSGGTIGVHTEEGVGTSFRLELPRAAAPGQANHPTESAPVLRGTETILVVDDEELLREVATLQLESAGYRVVAASDAREALEILDREPHISLLFSDVVMPGGMNGFDLADEVAKLRPTVKVLLTSGFVGVDTGHRFASALLKKPYHQADLARRVRELLNSYP